MTNRMPPAVPLARAVVHWSVMKSIAPLVLLVGATACGASLPAAAASSGSPSTNDDKGVNKHPGLRQSEPRLPRRTSARTSAPRCSGLPLRLFARSFARNGVVQRRRHPRGERLVDSRAAPRRSSTSTRCASGRRQFVGDDDLQSHARPLKRAGVNRRAVGRSTASGFSSDPPASRTRASRSSCPSRETRRAPCAPRRPSRREATGASCRPRARPPSRGASCRARTPCADRRPGASRAPRPG